MFEMDEEQLKELQKYIDNSKNKHPDILVNYATSRITELIKTKHRMLKCFAKARLASRRTRRKKQTIVQDFVACIKTDGVQCLCQQHLDEDEANIKCEEEK